MALKGDKVQEVIEMANRLARILQKVLKEIGLTLSIEKCRNFLIQMGENALCLFKRGDPT